MNHDEQVRLIKQLCAHLDAGTTVDAGGVRLLPTTDYTDSDLADRESQVFFSGNAAVCRALARPARNPAPF
jgi:hypothetical protein